MKKAGLPPETDDDNQRVMIQKKLRNIFGHIHPEQPPAVCPIRDILAPVTDKWSMLIVLFLGGHTTLRFNQLKKILYGASSKTVSERLKLLEQDGYVSRTAFAEVPFRVQYSLTPLGYRYLEQLLELTTWISDVMPGIVKRRYQFDQVVGDFDA
jgi:DNA-binding HxlR family transcriptional regulator